MAGPRQQPAAGASKRVAAFHEDPLTAGLAADVGVMQEEIAGGAQHRDVDAVTADVGVAGTGGSSERLSHLVLTGVTADAEQPAGSAR
jgi:hypothetical protein